MGNKFLQRAEIISFLRKVRPVGEQKWKTSFINRLVGVVLKLSGAKMTAFNYFENMFRKSKSCPTSERLLAYARSCLASPDMVVQAHVSTCEFCGAELHLLQRHHPLAEWIEVPQIPARLSQFALEILDGHRWFSLGTIKPASHRSVDTF